MSHSHIAVPPDGAGKKIATKRIVVVEFINETIPFEPGMTVTGDSSGATGPIIAVERTVRTDLYLNGEESTGEFTAGENLQVSSVTYAQVSVNSVTMHTQHMLIVDPDNPEHKQRVDAKGAASVRFSEGEMQFDSFGKTQTSIAASLGDYNQIYDLHPEEFWEDISAGCSSVHDPLSASNVLGVTGASGDKVYKTSNKYHIYQPGVSQNILMTVACGDSGKVNLRRRWGYFDVSDGIYFEQVETGMNVALRSSTSGSIVNTVIPQSQWNVDKLDGSGKSTIVLDETKVNIYWIDLQWLGAGRVRFGIFAPNGNRVVCHEMLNANNNTRAYIRTGSLPIRWEIENLGATGSSSEMRWICATVKTEGEFNPRYDNFGAHSPAPVGYSDAGYVPLLSFRAGLTFNALTNRIAAVMKHVDINIVPTNGESGSVRCSLVRNAPLTGGDWVYKTSTESSVEINRTATASGEGEKIANWLGIAGANHEDIHDLIDYFGNGYIRLGADGTTQDTYTIQVKANVTGETGVAFTAVSWSEYKG